MKKLVLALLTLLLTIAAVATYERTATATIGFRGVGMQVTDSIENLEDKVEDNTMPPALPPAPAGGTLAAQEYENVHVLGHLSTAQFTRLMTAITTWVAPEQGCNYCHNPNNLASDDKYQKVVSRRMLQMTQHINENWQGHVQQTGVTCYTCHRGQPVPEYIWFEQPEETPPGFVASRAHQNMPSSDVGLSSLPGNPFETYLDDETNIRVQSTQVFPGENRSSIKQAEWTYGLMMHFSNSLGVNCTYCHNSRSWADWSQSPIPRRTAWLGIRMVRNLNHDYLESLDGVFPASRLGELGDVPKLNCMTCHQQAYKPLLGQSTLTEYPSLARWHEQPDPADFEAPEPEEATSIESEEEEEETGVDEEAGGEPEATEGSQ